MPDNVIADIAMSQRGCLSQVGLWGWDTLRCGVNHPTWMLHAECTRQQLPWAMQRRTSIWVPYMEVRSDRASTDVLPQSIPAAASQESHA